MKLVLFARYFNFFPSGRRNQGKQGRQGRKGRQGQTRQTGQTRQSKNGKKAGQKRSKKPNPIVFSIPGKKYFPPTIPLPLLKERVKKTKERGGTKETLERSLGQLPFTMITELIKTSPNTRQF